MILCNAKRATRLAFVLNVGRGLLQRVRLHYGGCVWSPPRVISPTEECGGLPTRTREGVVRPKARPPDSTQYEGTKELSEVTGHGVYGKDWRRLAQREPHPPVSAETKTKCRRQTYGQVRYSSWTQSSVRTAPARVSISRLTSALLSSRSVASMTASSHYYAVLDSQAARGTLAPVFIGPAWVGHGSSTNDVAPWP